MNNLLEFLVGTEPKTAEQGKGPVYTNPGGVPTITLDCKSTSLTQASVTGKSGIDLASWPDTMTLFSTAPDSPAVGRTTLTFKDSAPLGGTKRFYRLEIVTPPAP